MVCDYPNFLVMEAEDVGVGGSACASGRSQRHYAAEVDSNLRRETNRLLNAQSVNT